MPAHNHSVTVPQAGLINGFSNGSGNSFYGVGTSTAATTNAISSSVGSGAESRPKNAAVVYIIKS